MINDNDELVYAEANGIRINTNTRLEVTVIQIALRYVVQQKWQNIHIEIDSLAMTNVIKEI